MAATFELCCWQPFAASSQQQPDISIKNANTTSTPRPTRWPSPQILAYPAKHAAVQVANTDKVVKISVLTAMPGIGPGRTLFQIGLLQGLCT